MNIAKGNCLHFYGFMGQDDKKRVLYVVIAADFMRHFALLLNVQHEQNVTILIF